MRHSLTNRDSKRPKSLKGGLVAILRGEVGNGVATLRRVKLRQQVAVLKQKRPRPSLNSWDRLLKPETVVGWHGAGFRLYWRWRSRPRGGRPKITEEIRVLIRRLAQENQGWGAPKIHG
jgi:hypothetical protein